MKYFLLNNKSLTYAIISGIFYFLLFWLTEYVDILKLFFIITIQFLPGLTFPLLTCYFNSESEKLNNRINIHLALSVLIYYTSVWIFSGEARFKFITLLAGAFGSLLFMTITRILLFKNLTIKQIVITTMMSGLAFVPFELLGKSVLLNGFSVLIWTVINGWLINIVSNANHKTVNIGSHITS